MYGLRNEFPGKFYVCTKPIIPFFVEFFPSSLTHRCRSYEIPSLQCFGKILLEKILFLSFRSKKDQNGTKMNFLQVLSSSNYGNLHLLKCVFFVHTTKMLFHFKIYPACIEFSSFFCMKFQQH